MSIEDIQIKELPQLEKPVLIAGFDGWGNALKISSGMAAYLIRKLNAKQFAKLNPDTFFRYDDARPFVNIEEGILKSIVPPEGAFYAACTDEDSNDVVILKADEPNLKWYRFIEETFLLCHKLGIETIITLGSMYDNVLHTDRVISGIASSQQLVAKLSEQNINSISYQGPSAIHSIIQIEGSKKGFQCISLWSHCPFYLQGTTHFGILSHLGALLSSIGNFDLDIADLEKSWKNLNEQIQELVKNNPDIQNIISELRKSKVRGSVATMNGSFKDEKVINIEDFLEPK
jgi:proteasome assembly chaperone (PAC2) family protein